MVIDRIFRTAYALQKNNIRICEKAKGILEEKRTAIHAQILVGL
jgi:hypothetical protein